MKLFLFAILAVNPSLYGDHSMADSVTVTPNAFQGSDAERINQAIEAAVSTGATVVIPRWNHAEKGKTETWLLDAAILLRSNTTLVLDNCRIKLSDRCRDNMLRSANCGLGITEIEPMSNIHIRGVGNVVLEGADHPRATGDSGKTLGKHTYGTDAGVDGESQRGDWRNIGILLAFVENFSIENLAIHDSHCWAVSLERCAHGRVRDLRFASLENPTIDGARVKILNRDGLDLRLGCHDILIENISGHVGDDLVALTAIPSRTRPAGTVAATQVSGYVNRREGLDDIRDIVVRNVRGCSTGGHHIVRLLNTPGVCMHDIVVDGVLDTSPPGHCCAAAVKIGDSNYGGGAAPLGDTSRIVVSNVISQARNTILLGGSLADSAISNVIRQAEGGDPITYGAGEQMVRNVLTSNLVTAKK
ncbi:MAG: hypothetical protein HN420_02025 [Rhodospirillaceae bacterium]|nr:hypothetical protein [Rhodospirillaceae bacterium]